MQAPGQVKIPQRRSMMRQNALLRKFGVLERGGAGADGAVGLPQLIELWSDLAIKALENRGGHLDLNAVALLLGERHQRERFGLKARVEVMQKRRARDEINCRAAENQQGAEALQNASA